MKKKILIPMLIIMITVVSVGFAAWNIINQEKTRVPSEYFPYSVDYEQESVYDGTYQDIDIKFDNLDISLENSNLVILYYKYTYSVNEETGKVSHSLDKLDGKPKNHGTYIAKVYQKNGSEGSMDPISIANPYTEICNVRFDILQREVRVTALDEEIYFGQSKSDVTFDYVIEEADGDRGLIAGDVLTESSNFSLDVAYNTYDDAKDYDITISGLTNSDNNYNISYVPGTFTVKKLPISFTWDKTSTVYNGSYQRPTVIASTTINIDLNTVIANSSVDVIYNTDYNGQSTLIDANLNGYDVRCVGINNQNYEVVNYPNSINYIIDQYPVNIKWENSEFTFNGKLQYQKANIITPLFYNEKDSKDDICNINYDTNGMINANVDKDGNSLPNNSQYIVNITGISNSNYKINASYSDYLSYAYYDIKPKLLTLAWPKENIFEYNNEEKIVQVLSEDIVSGYPSGLYYEGHQENANFVDANTQIEGSSKYYSVANITSTNYYLLDENATCEFRITQKEVFMNWDSKTQFEYAGQWEEDNSARKLHCPTGYLSEVIPGTDAGLSISGGQTNANHNHEGIKYDNFDDYVAVASISNSNYKLISNTTKAFEIWAYQAEVVIDNTKENAVLFTPFNTNGYDTLIYTYEALDFTPNASVTTHIFTGDICNVYVELLNTLGNYQLSVKDAGSYVAETTGLSNPNYSMVVKEYLNVVIEPKEINVLWGTDLENINNDLIFEYNSYSQIPVAVLDGVCDDDINAVSISVDNSYAQTNANVNRNENPGLISSSDYYTVALTYDEELGEYILSGNRAFNYKFASIDECQATFMIKQAALTISSIKKEITYGEAPDFTSDYRNIEGLKGTDTVDVLVGLESYVSYNQFDNVTDTDLGRTYYSIWQGVNNTNYDITYEDADFIVNKLDVTISWDSTVTNIYNGEEWAPSVELVGLVNNDPVSCVRSGLETDANVGNSSYTASVSSITSTNGKHVNYNVTNIDLPQDFTITPREISISWSGYTGLIYDGQAQEITNTPSNIIPKDNGNIGYLVTYYNGSEALDNAPINAGENYSAIVTVESTNYYIKENNESQAFEVAKRPISISWSDYTGLIYDGEAQEITDTPSNIIPKDNGNIGYLVTYYNGSAALNGAPINAGTAYSAKASVNSENYYVEELTATQSFEVAKRKLTINWTAPTDLTYDGENKTYDTTLINVVDGEYDSIGFVVNYYQAASLLGTEAPINAGTAYSAIATITSQNYYFDETNTTQKFDIAKRQITISWSNYEGLIYDGEAQEITDTPSNIIPKDNGNIGYLVTYYNGSTALDSAPINAGTAYSVKATITSENYYVTNETQAFEVAKKQITVVWSTTSNLVYNGGIHTFNATPTEESIVESDKTTVSLSVSYYNGDALLESAPKNAGTAYSALASVNSENYYIEEATATNPFEVAKRTLEISWGDLEVIYDKTPHLPSYEFTNLAEGDTADTLSITFVGKYASGMTNVEYLNGEIVSNQYIITLSGDNSINYQVNQDTTVSLKVLPKEIVVSWNEEGLEYIAAKLNPAAITSGLIDGDTCTLSYNQELKNAGTYYNLAAYVDNTNYVIVSGATLASLTVNPTKLMIKAESVTLSTIYQGEVATVISGTATINNGATTVTNDGKFVFDPDGSNGSDKEYSGSGKTTLHEGIRVKFVPNAEVAYNYIESDYVEASLYVQAAASVGYNGTYYATVEEALDATVNATSATIVYVLPIENDVLNHTPIIRRNCIVGSKVTLLLPHTSSEITMDSTQGYLTKTLDSAISKDSNGSPIYDQTIKSLLQINAGVELSVKGNLNVSANLYSKGLVGIHGVLINNGTINVEGNLYAYGFIKGSGNIILNSTAKYTDVFRIFNFPGGKNAYAMSEINMLPFSAYSFHNVSCDMRIEAGAVFQAYAVIDANNSWMIEKNIVFIGNSASTEYFFRLESGHIEKSTKDAFGDDSYKTTVTADNQLSRQKEVLKIYGNLSDGQISIKVSVAGFLNKTITTGTDLPVPIGFMEFYAMEGTVDITKSSYQFLPGSYLYIGELATFNIGGGVQFRFYDDYADNFDYYNGETAPRENGYDTSHSYRYHHSDWYAAKTSLGENFGGRLEIEGHLDCKGSISGKVKGKGNGRFDVLGGTSTNIKLLTKLHYEGGTNLYLTKLSSATSADDYQEMKGDINGSYQTFTSGQTYYYNQENGCWGTGKALITFETNCNIDIPSYEVYGSSNGHVVSNEILDSIANRQNKEYYENYVWYLDSSFTTEYTGQALYSNTTLYAKWIGKEYTVSFDGNGVENPESIKVRYGEEYSSLPELSREGYDFVGWKYSGNTIYNSSIVTATSNHTLVAEWSAISSTRYTVTVDVDGNTTSFLRSEGAQIGSFEVPTKTGYTFARWVYEDNSPVNSTDTVNEDTTIYATWTPNEYTVTFDKTDGETAGTTTATVKFGLKPETLPSSSLPTQTGYTFTGYYTAETGGEKYYNGDGSGAKEWELTQNTRLYAQWSPNTYTVTLNADGGSVTPSSITVTYGGKYSNLPTPNRDGNTFDGWKCNNDVITNDTEVTIASDHTLTAQWKPNSGGGGSCFASGVMINMADGTLKAIEDIRVGDQVLVMNHLTGKVEISVISINVHDSVSHQYYDVLDLEFSNGTMITIANDHGFYDITLGRYVAISLTNYHEYLGHEFYYYDVSSNVASKVTLVNGTIENRYCQVFAPFTYEHLNLFAEGLLTLTGEVVELYNAFEFDETVAYDKEAMEADIEKYGLYTYEDFKDYATEEEFNAFNAKYFKVAVGKGYLTYEQVLYYIQTYLRD